MNFIWIGRAFYGGRWQGLVLGPRGEITLDRTQIWRGSKASTREIPGNRSGGAIWTRGIG